VSATKTDSPAGVFAALKATPTPLRYLLGGVFINQMGAFVQTFLVLYLSFRGFSLSGAGAALTAYSVGAVFGTLLGGELTHRFGPRGTIVGAMATSAVIVGSLPVLSHPDRFGFLLAGALLAGLVTQAYRPAASVLLSELMPKEFSVMAFSMMRIAMNLGAAVGPLIAAGLILLDWDLLFYFDAVTALVYSLLAFALLPKTTVEDKAEKPAEDKKSAYLVLLRDNKYLLYLASMLLSAAIYVQYTVALPLKITAEGHSTALYSAALATSSTILILCELKITSYVRHWPTHVAGFVGTTLLGLGLGGYGLSTQSSALIIFSTVVFVSGLMVSGPTMFAHPATFPAEVKARYIGASQAMFGLGTALGPTLGVLAWAEFGNGIWLWCAVIGVLAALCALVGMKKTEVSEVDTTAEAAKAEPAARNES
jgi:MFS family permease